MNWFEILTDKVEQLGRRTVERDCGISKTALSQVLNHIYEEKGGSLRNIEAAVLSAYANIKVTCPVLGEIPVKRCTQEQKRDFVASSPVRIKLYRACMTCPQNKKNGGLHE